MLMCYCVEEILLACRHVKNGVLELYTTIHGANEVDDCDYLLSVYRLASCSSFLSIF